MLKPKISLKRQDFDFSGVQGNFVTKRVSEKSVTDPDTTGNGTKAIVTGQDSTDIDQKTNVTDPESTAIGTEATVIDQDKTGSDLDSTATGTDPDSTDIDQETIVSAPESTATGTETTATEPDTTATVATMVEFGSIKLALYKSRI